MFLKILAVILSVGLRFALNYNILHLNYIYLRILLIHGSIVGLSFFINHTAYSIFVWLYIIATFISTVLSFKNHYKLINNFSLLYYYDEIVYLNTKGKDKFGPGEEKKITKDALTKLNLIKKNQVIKKLREYLMNL